MKERGRLSEGEVSVSMIVQEKFLKNGQSWSGFILLNFRYLSANQLLIIEQVLRGIFKKNKDL